VNGIPLWLWLGGGLVLLFLIFARRGGRTPLNGSGQPIQPGNPGTPDKTAQNPKTVPWRG
jgi:hypothetical protein